MKRALPLISICIAATAQAQIQVEMKLPRLQYIAYEPIVATLQITNLAGRDVDLHDASGQAWFGFEVTGADGQTISRINNEAAPPLKIEAGKRVTQKINITPLYDVHDFGTYHVRAHVYFADLEKFSTRRRACSKSPTRGRCGNALSACRMKRPARAKCARIRS